jgi:hypothetical protein
MAENRDVFNDGFWRILQNDKPNIVILLYKNEKLNNQPFNGDCFTSILLTCYRQKSGKKYFYGYQKRNGNLCTGTNEE